MTTRAESAAQAVRTPRAAAIAGIAFAVLLGVSLVLIFVAIPDESRQAGEWVIDDSKRGAVKLALNLVPYAGIAFLWFIGVIRDRLGDREDRFFASVFLGSGLLFVGMLFTAGAIAGGLLAPVDDLASAPSTAVWTNGRRVTRLLIVTYGMRMAAVFMMSTTTLAMRLQIIPRWFAIAGFVGAIVLLLTVSIAPWLELIFPAWVLVLSTLLLVESFRRPSLDAATS